MCPHQFSFLNEWARQSVLKELENNFLCETDHFPSSAIC